MANRPGLRQTIAAAAIALSGFAAEPANAQFMTGAYPVIIVPPAQEQNMGMPKKPKPQTPPQTAPTPPPDQHDPGLSQNYQGRTRVGR